jgi:UDP:flavonoid glycosyltransferase YjiC (YdhE family)
VAQEILTIAHLCPFHTAENTMSTILVAWEFGTGFGHITRIQPIVRGLLRSGHRVVMAARDVAPCYGLLRNLDVPVFQAPLEVEPRGRTVVETYAHVLFNCGFAEPAAVVARVASWRNLFGLVEPDFIVADCSPTALLAGLCSNIPGIALGTGFECPPDVTPLPSLRRQTRPSGSMVDSIEPIVLDNINVTCAHFGAAPLDRISQLYYSPHRPLLLTYPELDCYAPRADGHYWGAVAYSNGDPARWPLGHGPRVFAYMLEHEFTPVVVRLLAQRSWPTLVVGGKECIAKSQIALPDSVRIADSQLDSQSIALQCDFTICYAGHGTICATLRAGKPILLLPTTVEQYLNSIAVTNIGAGRIGQVGNTAQLGEALEQLATNRVFKLAADRFASEKRISSPQPVADQVVAHLHALLTV